MTELEKYLAAATPTQRAEFERIRALVYEMAPQAEESISYGMPAYKYKRKPLLYFGIFKDHMSLFPTGGITDKLAETLKMHKTSKGTIQFTEKEPISDAAVKEILRLRISQIEER